MSRIFAKIALNKSVSKYITLALVYILMFACIMATFTFKDIAINTLENTLLNSTFNNHILLKSKTNERFFDEEKLIGINNEKIKHITEMIATEVNIVGRGNDHSLLVGLNLNDIENLGIQVKEKSDNFKGKDNVLISNSYAIQNRLKLNEEITITNDYGEEKQCLIAAICQDSTFFTNNMLPIIMEKKQAQEFTHLEDKISTVYIQLYDIKDIDEIFLQIGQIFVNENIYATKIFNIEQYSFYIEPVALVLTIFTILAGILAIVMTYYTFKANIAQRIRSYSILMSFGITKKKIFTTLLCEALIFTSITIIVGSLFGILSISILLKMFVGVNRIAIVWKYILIIALAMIIFTSLLVCFIGYTFLKPGTLPILKGIPLKMKISKNRISEKNKIYITIFLSTVLIAIAISLLFVDNIVAQCIGAIMFFIASSIFTYYLIDLLIIINKSLSKNHFPKKFFLFTKAHESMRLNKGGIITIFIMVTLISVVGVVGPLISNNLTNLYKDIQIVGFLQGDIIDVESIKSVDKNISEIYETYIANQSVNDKSIKILGVDTDNYQKISSDVFNYQLKEMIGGEVDRILISSTYLKSNNLKVGDFLSLKSLFGNVEYEIVGEYHTYENQGSNFIVSKQNFQRNFTAESKQILIKVSNSENIKGVMENISNISILKNKLVIMKTEDIIKSNKDNINTILAIVGILVIVLGVMATISWCMSMQVIMKEELKSYDINRMLGIGKNSVIKELGIVYVGIIAGLISLIACLFTGVLNFYLINILSYSVGHFKYRYIFNGLPILAIVLVIFLTFVFTANKFKRNKTMQ